VQQPVPRQNPPLANFRLQTGHCHVLQRVRTAPSATSTLPITEDYNKLAQSISDQGKKLAEPTTGDSVECLECDLDGESSKYRSLLNAWRLVRDWEPELAKLNGFEYEYGRPMDNGKLDVSYDR
ncbi:hypothetical protein CORC01_02711, partial [Colletotrichum orchidophilum]